MRIQKLAGVSGMEKFSSNDRKALMQQMEKATLDLLVIGGGITGAGITLDATTRGMRASLIEMQDFAAGTSSRSTKLVHGGLRYLKQLEVAMVAEVGKERAIVYENGPHVTSPEWMMLPFHKGGTFGPFTTNIGLRVYDFLAGVKKNERRKMLSPKETLQKEPLLNAAGIKGAGYYVEYKTDDARLTIEVVKKAVEHGAEAINYMKAVDYIYDDAGKVIGVVAEDQITGQTHHIQAKKIVNATGPWVDELREMDGSKQGKTLHLTKGVHLVFRGEDFPLQQAIYFDAPDGRMIFAIPREGKAYVGTTDTDYRGEIEHPDVTEEDRDYIVAAVQEMFPGLSITKEDVESSWAGLRPLISEAGKNPDEISRKDEIFISDTGLISIAGGKLTGYRKMSEEAVDVITRQLKAEEGILYSDSPTKNVTVSGGNVGGSKGYHSFKQEKKREGTAMGIPEETVMHFIEKYGSNADILMDIYFNQASTAKKEGVDPAVFAQLLYAMDYEMVYKPVDFFIRRTGALFFDLEWVKDHKNSVITYMAKKLSWDDHQLETYVEELEHHMEAAMLTGM